MFNYKPASVVFSEFLMADPVPLARGAASEISRGWACKWIHVPLARDSLCPSLEEEKKKNTKRNG